MSGRLGALGVVIVLLILVGLLAVSLWSKGNADPAALDASSARTEFLRDEWPPASPTTSTTAPPAPSTTTTTAVARSAPIATPVPMSTWDDLAQCESGGNWADRRGGYEGGLHFAPPTWRRAVALFVREHPARSFPAHAYLASRLDQIEIAVSWLRRTSWRQWPSCSLQLGLR